jgi:prolyl-tRNA synthetase
MKFSQILIPTQKEVPNDAEVISHQLLIRSGMISKLASGLYSYLPLGLKVLQKIENIIRDEMNKSGAQEVLMPVAQPAELWQESGRWEKYGKELLRFQDRHNRDFCLGPTHEEVIVDLARQYLRSYKQLPVNFYQIQTKFRDEVRPRFGLMRGREFVMKDAYSFHLDKTSMKAEFENMHDTYCRIFDRLGLDYRPVMADSGSIGGEGSIEFHVLAESGEDDICFSDSSDYAANIEKVAFNDENIIPNGTQEIQKVHTPNVKTIAELVEFLGVDITQTIKALIIKTEEGFKALFLRGDHELNEIKAQNLFGEFSFATDKELQELGLFKGSIGVIGLDLEIIVDYSASYLADFICGANEADYHLTGVNWQDATYQKADLRNAVVGDNSPCGKGKLEIKRGIEVGHIFQLQDTYSGAMNAGVIGESGKQQIMLMGCYGIGVSRVMAATIEQNNDEKGIIWPESIAPFKVIIVPINYHKSGRVQELADNLYSQMLDKNIEVLIDDRKERPGIMFKDSELIGIPHRVVISDTHADNGNVEYASRKTGNKQEIKFVDVINFIKEL